MRVALVVLVGLALTMGAVVAAPEAAALECHKEGSGIVCTEQVCIDGYACRTVVAGVR